VNKQTEILRIVADAHIWGVEAAFSSLPGFDVQLRTLEARDINRAALSHADVLITRSGTRVNQALIGGSPLRFAATATIGDDHYDKNYLNQQGVAWANAAGSSTDSVIEYMLTVLLELHARQCLDLRTARLGIIGAGRIGGGLADICTAMGIPCLLNDPPRARAEGADGFIKLQDMLQEADILSLHTPLNKEGEDCSVHLLDAEKLSTFKGTGIINAGRGACLDNAALLQWLDMDSKRFAVLDCWEEEPAASPALLAHPQLIIGTPHIAGHSLDGKAANTLYAYRALCQWLGIEPDWHPEDSLPAPSLPLNIPCEEDVWSNLHRAATALYPIMQDDAALRGSGAEKEPDEGGARFTAYRRHYPVRRGWHRCPLHFLRPNPITLRLAQAMRIKIV